MLWHNASGKRLARHAHDGRNARALCKHDFELFQTTAHGLGVAKVDDGENDRGDDEENKVVFPANGFNGNLVLVSSLYNENRILLGN